MKNVLSIAVVAILFATCKQEVQSPINSQRSDQLTAIVYNTWSGWVSWRGEKVNFWYADKTIANYMATIMRNEYLDTDSTKTFAKRTLSGAVDLQDPCDPISPPEEGDVVIRSHHKTYILHKNGTTEMLDCGSGNGGDPVSFTISFTFSGNGYNVPDYTVTITVWEQGGEYISATVDMKPSSGGAYGNYTQETDPSRGVSYTPNGYDGGTLTFNVNANTQSTMGFSAPNTNTTQTQHANFLMNMSGYIPLDNHFNISAKGRAWLKSRRSK